MELMSAVLERDNMMRAYERVLRNKGAAGVDGMMVGDLKAHLKGHWPEIRELLQDGRYTPLAVRKVEIPKPGGGMRMLGVPTVQDRLIQQALLQVLSPVFEKTFSNHSYGFRPGRSAAQAVQQARCYIEEGRRWVVDADLEKFFDRVNHDILMSRVAREVKDKRILKLIRSYLQAGIMEGGVATARSEGTPQGGPLSPLLSNILLTDLDRELERRGHRYCRYADDCNIYVRTEKAGERVMASVTRFLKEELWLQVNREKSAVAPVQERQFLGYRILWDGRPAMAPRSLERAKRRIRQITRRNRGISLERMIGELNSYLTGWVTYFRYAACRSHLKRLDEWIRRKLRCVRLKQRKRAKPLADFLQSLGVPEWSAWILALSGKGWWRKSGTPQASQAMSIAWFKAQGLVSLFERYAELQP